MTSILVIFQNYQVDYLLKKYMNTDVVIKDLSSFNINEDDGVSLYNISQMILKSTIDNYSFVIVKFNKHLIEYLQDSYIYFNLVYPGMEYIEENSDSIINFALDQKDISITSDMINLVKNKEEILEYINNLSGCTKFMVNDFDTGLQTVIEPYLDHYRYLRSQ